jgi:hypothetical protein
MKEWSLSQAQILHSIYGNTPSGGVIVTDTLATAKFINELYGSRHVADTGLIGTGQAGLLIQMKGCGFGVSAFNQVSVSRRKRRRPVLFKRGRASSDPESPRRMLPHDN